MTFADDVAAHFKTLADHDRYSGVVRISDRDAVVFETASGYASRAWRVPNTLDTRFDTASITKLFTAAAVLQQVDAGHLALDTRVVDFLGLHGTTISPEVTVFHLLTHSSGIGDDADEEAGESYEELWRERPNYSVYEAADLVPGFAQKPANFAPGEGCRYNNAGYVLLGMCVEEASGQPYRTYVTERVFGRAGMDRSGFFRMDHVHPDVAEGADPILDDDGVTVGWRRNIYSYPPIGTPDAGAYVTAADLDRFLCAARSGRLFSEAMTELGHSAHVFHSASPTQISRYGICLEFVYTPDDRLKYVQKDGYNAGTSGIVRFYPAIGLTVVMLSNTSEGVWQPLKDVDRMVRCWYPCE
jgi:CubicO group peptidase (beta-lactamase class C family)